MVLSGDPVRCIMYRALRWGKGHIIKKNKVGAGTMAHQLRTFVILAKDLGSVHSTQMVAYNSCISTSGELYSPLLSFTGTRYSGGTRTLMCTYTYKRIHIHTHTHLHVLIHTHKIKIKKKGTKNHIHTI